MLGGSKMKSIFSIGKDFDRYKDEVNRHNGNMIEIMLYGGILMTILAILAQLFMGYLSAMLLAVRMLIYMLILVLLRRPVLSKIQNKTLLIYLLQAPILFTVLLMGTFMDPNHQAITIFVFVSVLPLLILDKPWRVAGWTAGWLLFLLSVLIVSRNLVTSAVICFILWNSDSHPQCLPLQSLLFACARSRTISKPCRRWKIP